MLWLPLRSEYHALECKLLHHFQVQLHDRICSLDQNTPFSLLTQRACVHTKQTHQGHTFPDCCPSFCSGAAAADNKISALSPLRGAPLLRIVCTQDHSPIEWLLSKPLNAKRIRLLLLLIYRCCCCVTTRSLRYPLCVGHHC